MIIEVLQLPSHTPGCGCLSLSCMGSNGFPPSPSFQYITTDLSDFAFLFLSLLSCRALWLLGIVDLQYKLLTISNEALHDSMI